MIKMAVHESIPFLLQRIRSKRANAEITELIV